MKQEVRPSGTEKLSDYHETYHRRSVTPIEGYRGTGSDVTKAEVTPWNRKLGPRGQCNCQIVRKLGRGIQ